MNMNTIFKKFMALVAIITGFLTSGKANAQEKYSPSGTYQFAVKTGTHFSSMNISPQPEARPL